MPPQEVTAGCPAPEWEAQNLRVTIFLSPSGSPPDPEDWQKFVGAPPEKKLEITKVGSIQCEGAFASGNLTFRVAPIRVDWIYAVRIDPDASEPPKSTIGPYKESASAFITLIHRWLANCPHVQRLAYGAVLHLPVESHEEGYSRLNTLLSDVNVDPTTKDFSYHINRPRRSSELSLRELQINRLSQWSVAATEIVQFIVGGLRARKQPKQYSCRLVLDISTAAEREEDLPQNLLPSLLNELYSLGQEISERGDIP